MKKLLLATILCLATALSLVAQIQQGYVKTPGRLGNNGQVIPGKRIAGAAVQVKGRSAVVSNDNGMFSFPIPANKFFIQSVKKTGYVLTDPEATARQYSYTTSPLILVIEIPSQQTENKLANERKIRHTLQQQLKAKEDEVEALKAQNKINQEEYQKRLQQLYANQESNEKLIRDMAERYSQMDFDQMDEFNLRISDCIINGRLTEADSLLRSKGDINSRIAELNQHHEANEQAQATVDKSKAMEKKNRDDIAKDCYSYFQKFFTEHQNDSAAHYLELRAALDTTNFKWQNEAGLFISNYLANYDLALEYYERGLAQVQKQLGKESEWTAIFYYNIGEIYYLQHEFGDATENYQKAIEINEQSTNIDTLDVSNSHNSIGLLYQNLRQYDKALEFYLKSIDIQERVLGIEHPLTVRSYYNIGKVYCSLGDYRKALEYSQKALSIQELVLGKDHPDVANTYESISLVYFEQCDYTKALDYSKKALDIQKSVLGHDHPNVATSYINIGLIYDRQGNCAMALEYYQKALSVQELVLSNDHPDIAKTYKKIGFVYFRQGDYAKALECYLNELRIYKKTFGAEHTFIATKLRIVSGVYHCLNKHEKELEYLQMALDILELPKNNKDALKTSINRVEINSLKAMIRHVKERLESPRE